MDSLWRVFWDVFCNVRDQSSLYKGLRRSITTLFPLKSDLNDVEKVVDAGPCMKCVLVVDGKLIPKYEAREKWRLFYRLLNG